MIDMLMTGGRPTGALHLAHYAGVFNKFFDMQHNAVESYFVISDVHFLTTRCEKSAISLLPDNIHNMIVDCMSMGGARGIPQYYLQSQIPEVSELYMIIHNLVSVKRLKRTPSIVELLGQEDMDHIPLGLLAYPVMEAADIIAMRADEVVVGKDNVDHLKIASEIVMRLNDGFGCELHNPRCISDEYSMVGLDGVDKMSKSKNNAILLMDSESEIDRKISGAVFPNANACSIVNPVIEYIRYLAQESTAKRDLLRAYEAGDDIERTARQFAKEVIDGILRPIRERGESIRDDRGATMKILKEGTEAARSRMVRNIQTIKRTMRLVGWAG